MIEGFSEIWLSFTTLNSSVQTLIVIAVVYLMKAGILSIPKIHKGKDEAKREHRTCPLYPEYKQALIDERGKGERIFYIKKHETIYDQMCIVQVAAEEIFDLLTEMYESLLKKENITDEQRTAALTMYAEICDGALDHLVGYLRKWVRKNHFAELDDVAFQAYIQKRVEEALNKYTKYITRRYVPYIFIIPRDVLHDNNFLYCIPKISTKMTTMFVEIRAIAEKKAEEIRKIEEL